MRAVRYTCRTTEQIEFNFNALQRDLEVEIDERLNSTRQKLLEPEKRQLDTQRDEAWKV